MNSLALGDMDGWTTRRPAAGASKADVPGVNGDSMEGVARAARAQAVSQE